MVLPARLGDTIICTPAISFLKRCCPETQIDVICLSDLSASVLDHNPNIHQIYVLPSKREIKHRIDYYDIGINIHDGDNARKYFRWLELDLIGQSPKDPNKHQAHQALDIIQSLLKREITEEDQRYTLYPQSHHFDKVKGLLLSQGVSLSNDILVGCHIGCHGIAKRGKKFWKSLFWKSLTHHKIWPLENFIALEAAARKYNPRMRFVLTGSKTEKSLGKIFKRQSKDVIDLTGKISVLELAALMSYLRTYITSDTGALHVACAANVDLITLFGPTSLKRTGPYPPRSNHTVIRQPSMAEIRVQNVLDALIDY